MKEKTIRAGIENAKRFGRSVDWMRKDFKKWMTEGKATKSDLHIFENILSGKTENKEQPKEMQPELF